MRDREKNLSWEKYISLINLYLVVNEHVNKHTCKSNRIKTDHAVNISLKIEYMYFIKIFIMYQCLYVKTLNRKKNKFKKKKWGVNGSVLWGEMEGKHTIVL